MVRETAGDTEYRKNRIVHHSEGSRDDDSRENNGQRRMRRMATYQDRSQNQERYQDRGQNQDRNQDRGQSQERSEARSGQSPVKSGGTERERVSAGARQWKTGSRNTWRSCLRDMAS